MDIPFPVIAKTPVGFTVPDRGTGINAIVIANRLGLRASYRYYEATKRHEVFVLGNELKIEKFKQELEKIT